MKIKNNLNREIEFKVPLRAIGVKYSIFLKNPYIIENIEFWIKKKNNFYKVKILKNKKN